VKHVPIADGGRDVAKLVLVILAFTAAFAHAQSVAEISGELVDLKAPVIGKSLTCSQPTQRMITIPHAFIERAKIKSRLANLLRLSLFDDADGTLNIEREKEIKKLANKLKRAP
jgi:hypothetical protein